MKKLRPGELRFITKQIDKVYRVYDRAKASFPYKSTELGDVIQDVTEAEAQAEADRLNKKFVKTAAPVKARVDKNQKTGSSAQETIEVDDLPEFEAADEEDLPEVEAYGELTDDERKKMEASLGL